VEHRQNGIVPVFRGNARREFRKGKPVRRPPIPGAGKGGSDARPGHPSGSLTYRNDMPQGGGMVTAQDGSEGTSNDQKPSFGRCRPGPFGNGALASRRRRTAGPATGMGRPVG